MVFCFARISRRSKRIHHHAFTVSGNEPLPHLPDVAYAIALTRAYSGVMDIWRLRLEDTLPIIPVPLRFHDADVALDVPTIMREVYDEAAYDLSINYNEPPPPPTLSNIEQQWLERHIGDL